ncbi:MAG: hypothetical protein CL610_09450 [Anaerolineaceae bacterium]|nr:hypothetical protein [Anaerolineaceae bacterium]
MLVGGLFVLLRQLEHWLHQHIFKVGWLVTKSFQTTTILYYTFFLPGVFLHELSFWFVAGILNVHAKSSIQWPEAQEIAELKLSFVELSRDAGPFRLALITLAPLITGVTVVWLIANNLLDFNSFFALIRSGGLSDVSAAIGQLTSTTDFWLWTYILFTISNTMIPRLQDLKGLRIVLILIAVAAAALIFIGVGNEVVVQVLVGPVADALFLLAGTFAVIIFIDLIFVVLLGSIEAAIERVTGDSAMFRRGKLVAMTRQEIREMRQRQSRRETRALQSRNAAKESRKPSIYSRPLAIPGPPGEEPVTQSSSVIVEPDEQPALQTGTRPDDRRGPDMITGSATANRSSMATPALIAPPEPDKEDEDEGESPALHSTPEPTESEDDIIEMSDDDEDEMEDDN